MPKPSASQIFLKFNKKFCRCCRLRTIIIQLIPQSQPNCWRWWTIEWRTIIGRFGSVSNDASPSRKKFNLKLVFYSFIEIYSKGQPISLRFLCAAAISKKKKFFRFHITTISNWMEKCSYTFPKRLQIMSIAWLFLLIKCTRTNESLNYNWFYRYFFNLWKRFHLRWYYDMRE